MTARPDEVVAWMVFGKSEEWPEPIAIKEYTGSMEFIRERVMAKAKREGFSGDFVTRMSDLGWWLEPLVRESALQSANARLAAVREAGEFYLMASDPTPTKHESTRVALAVMAFGTSEATWSAIIDKARTDLAEAIRRAAAGEGDANQGDGE